MEIVIDPEFRDLIPALSEEELNGLEKSIVENGFNPAFPLIVWKGHNILVEGHNRYNVCMKHDIEPLVIEQYFESREQVMSWMIENQLSRRNLTTEQKNDLIGKKYNFEKKSRGGAKGNNCTLNVANKVAEEFDVSSKSVKNAGKYSESLDKISETCCIRRSDLMSKTSMHDVNEIAKMNINEQKVVVNKLVNGEITSLKETQIERSVMITFSVALENKNRMVSMLGMLNKDQWLNELIHEAWIRANLGA
jgi:hypothetical protein